MKIQVVGMLAIGALLLSGCTAARQSMGASAENDQNVLTGGPIVGTTIADLPQQVRNALREKVPNAEIADIERTSHNGEIVYRISFLEPGLNPTVYIQQDGKMLSGSELMDQEK